MDRIIITPTFRPHFPFNRDFLASYAENASDASEVPIHFVVSRAELADLREMIDDFPSVTAHAHAIEDILAAAGYEVEAAELLGSVGKFAFQCLKKLYALKGLSYDQALILDSEALLLKPTRVADAFDEYYADPYVFYSDLNHRNARWYGELGDVVNTNAAKLLGVPYPKMHLLEYYGWFYDKRLVTGMFEALPADLLTAVRKLGRDKHIFECVLYYTYLFNNQDRHDHRFVSVNDLLKEYLGESGYAEYIKNFTGHWEQVGIFEFVSKEVTERNLPDLLRLFDEKRLRFYRSELVNHNERVQEALIADSPITFLVSSENYRRIRERIAVCISGAPRDYRVNLKHLKDFLGGSNVDLFAHFWNAPDRDVIVRELSPVDYEFEDVATALQDADGVHSLGRRAGARLHSAARANALKQRHEAASGFVYDVVVSISVDLLALVDLVTVIDRVRAVQLGFDCVIYVPGTGQGSGLDGHVVVGGSRAMDVVAALGDELDRELPTHDADLLLLRHVLDSGLTVQTFAFDYVVLDDQEALTLQDLGDSIDAGLAHASTAPAPAIPRALLDEYWSTKAESVAVVAQLGLSTARAFRLRAPGGYLRLGGSTLSLAGDGGSRHASSFVLVAAGDEDVSAVNIRGRDLLVGSENPRAAAANLHPDRRGELRCDGAAVTEAAFMLSTGDGGVIFEWRPGFWRSPASADADAERLVLAAGATRVGLRPRSDGVPCTFAIEPVDDEAVAALKLGVQQGITTAQPTSADPPLTRLTWQIYTAARVFEEGGTERLVRDTKTYLRKVLNGRGGRHRTDRIASRLPSRFSSRVR